MGIDKEAMDIWRFGRQRPDLSPQETWEAAQVGRGDIDEKEIARRDDLLAEHRERRFREIAASLPKTKAEMEAWRRNVERAQKKSGDPAQG